MPSGSAHSRQAKCSASIYKADINLSTIQLVNIFFIPTIVQSKARYYNTIGSNNIRDALLDHFLYSLKNIQIKIHVSARLVVQYLPN